MTNIKREIGSHNSIDSHDSPYTSSSSSNAPPPPPPYYGNAHHSVPESLPPPTATTANSNTSSYVHDTRSTGHQVYTEGSSLNPEQEDSALPGTNSDTYATATMAAPPQPTAGGLSGVESFPSQQQQQQQSSLCGAIGYDERERRTYELVVCQQPLHARMCGFGEKDRRPIDPPPIVKLIVQQEQGPVDVQTLQTPFFVLHVTLWSADRVEERNIISNPPKCTRVLMGSLVSSPSLLKDPSGEQGLYFAFPDLSIRTEGRYTLSGIFLALGEFGPGDCMGLNAMELFPTAVRGTGYGIAAAMGKVGATVGTLAFQPMQDSMGVRGPFLVGSAITLVAAAVAFWCLPDGGPDFLNQQDEEFKKYLADNGYDISQLGLAPQKTYETMGNGDQTSSSNADNKNNVDSSS